MPVVSDYIQGKLNSIKKDSFLESITNLPFYRQRSLITSEIEQHNKYISVLKADKNSYEVKNNKKDLKLEIKKRISAIRRITAKYQEYCKYITLLNNYSSRQNQIKERIEFESSQVKISNDQLKLLGNLTKGNIKQIRFIDLIVLSKYMIQNYEVLEDHTILLDTLKEITSKILTDKDNEEYYIAISSLKSTISYKISSLDKNDSLRKPLGEMKRYIKSTLELCRATEDSKHDYRYEIIEYFLDDDYYFSRTLEDMPDIVNLKDKDGYSLAYNVVSKYLDIYLLEMQGKKSKVSKERYERIYKKIVNSSYYKPDQADIYNIDVLLNNFKETIKNGRFRRSKYNNAINDLENLKNEIVQSSNQGPNVDQLLFEQWTIADMSSKNSRRDLTHEETIVLANNNDKYYNCAYAVTKNNIGNYILKVHIPDIREFIKFDSELDVYLRNQMFCNNDDWLDKTLMSKFSLSQGQVKDVITFEIEVSTTGKIERVECYKSNIHVDTIYILEYIDNCIKNRDSRFTKYLEVYNLLNKDNDELPISDIFNTTVLNIVGKYFDTNRLPYIYKVKNSRTAEKYMETMTFLNQLFNKISKEDFYKFYRMICDDAASTYYDYNPGYYDQVKQDYYTDLLTPLQSYIGIILQDLINEFYLKEISSDQLEAKKSLWTETIKSIVTAANEIKEENRVNKKKKKIISLNTNVNKC